MLNRSYEDLIETIAKTTPLRKETAERVMHAVREDREHLLRNPSLVIKISPIHGRGVFATDDIPAGAILEECHFIELTETNFKNIDPALQEYVFSIDKTPDNPSTVYVVVLGISSALNHSRNHANTGWRFDRSRKVIVFKALKDIPAGAELFINYNSGKEGGQ